MFVNKNAQIKSYIFVLILKRSKKIKANINKKLILKILKRL
jgi:hypothetical protein